MPIENLIADCVIAIESFFPTILFYFSTFIVGADYFYYNQFRDIYSLPPFTTGRIVCRSTEAR